MSFTNVEQISRARDARAVVWAQMRALMDAAGAEARDLSAEEVQTYTTAEAELDRLSGQITLLERHGQQAAQMDSLRTDTRVLPSGDRVVTRHVRIEATEEYREAWTRWMAYGLGELTPEQRTTLRAGYARDTDEQRAQTVTTTGGGYLVPTEFQATLMTAMLAYGGVRGVANVITTDSGGPLVIPTVDDTTNSGRLLTINTAVTTVDVVFGQKQLDSYKYSSDQVLVPVELMQDSAFDMDAFVGDILAERLGRITESHYTTGTGTNQPNGVVTAATAGKTGLAGQTLTVIPDDLIDLFHSLDPAYRVQGGTVWMMADASVAKVRKLVTGISGDKTYIWQPGLTAGAPDTLLGFPVVVNQQVPVMAVSAKSILFGNFNRYWIRDTQGVRMVRMDERYADADQVGFVAFLRTDGDLIGPAGTIKAYVNSAT